MVDNNANMDLQFPWLEKRDTQLGKYSVEKLLLFRFEPSTHDSQNPMMNR